MEVCEMTTQEARRVLGAILNLTRYKPAATLEQANTRLGLIDQIALQALQDFKNTRFFESKELPAQGPALGRHRQRLNARTTRPGMFASPAKANGIAS
jgi:hypothetical protein